MGMSRLSRPDLDRLDSVNIDPDLNIEPDLDSILAESDSETMEMIVQEIRISQLILPTEKTGKSFNQLIDIVP